MADQTDLNDVTNEQTVQEGVEGAKRVKESDAEIIARLAKMSAAEHESKRKEAAEKLGWRRSFLDEEVNRVRAKWRANAIKSSEGKEETKVRVECPKLDHEDPISLLDSAIGGLGYGGDKNLPKLLYLCYTSRLLAFDRGNLLSHAQVVGSPSSGKNYLVDTALSLIPDTACLKIDAGSPKALIYSNEDLQHRLVVFTEADSLPIGEAGNGKSLADGDSRSTAASALRNLASDGYLSYDIVERDPETGHFVTRHIEKPGPTPLVTTTTRAISGQMGTRLWEVPMKESDEQVRAALDTCATTELTRERQVPSKLVQYQSYLQSRAPWDAIVRFAKELVEELFYKGANPRIQRDYQRILALIKAVTVLRHPQRGRDSKDRLISTLDDYKTVREVLNDTYAATVSNGLTEDVRHVVDAVKTLRGKGALTVTYDAVANHLSWYVQKAHRKAKVALTHGWLVNQQTKPRQPADLIIGEPMPADRGLPTVEAIQELFDKRASISPQNGCERENARNDAASDCERRSQGGENAVNAVNDDGNRCSHVEPAPEAAFPRSHAFRREEGGVCSHCSGEGCCWCVGEEV